MKFLVACGKAMERNSCPGGSTGGGLRSLSSLLVNLLQYQLNWLVLDYAPTAEIVSFVTLFKSDHINEMHCVTDCDMYFV